MQFLLKPGSRFSYSGVGYMYLQRAIEGITRRPFNDFMTQTVFAKLGMGSTSYFRAFGESHMARGHGYVLGFAMPVPYFPMEQPNAANLLCTTAPDLAKFVAELMSPSIVNKNLVDQMLSPQVHMGGDVWWGLGIALYPAGKRPMFLALGRQHGFRKLPARLSKRANRCRSHVQQLARPTDHPGSCEKGTGRVI